MTKAELVALRHPSERSRYWISMLVVVPILFVFISVTLQTQGAPLIVVLSTVFLAWLITRIVSAILLGNAIRVSPENFPDIDAAVTEYKNLFGYRRKIEVYVYDVSGFNASLLTLLRRKVILINADVIAHAKSENEVRWIIARFVGALASKHYRFSWLQFVMTSIEKLWVLNIFLFPYERAVVKSGDQLGLYAINGDICSAVRASQKIMAGGALGDRVALTGVLHQQEAISGSFFGWLATCLSPLPHMTARIANLIRIASVRYPQQLNALLAGDGESIPSVVQSDTIAASRA